MCVIACSVVRVPALVDLAHEQAAALQLLAGRPVEVCHQSRRGGKRQKIKKKERKEKEVKV